MVRAKAQGVKEHSDLGEGQSAGWGRSLGKEGRGAGTGHGRLHKPCFGA